MGHGAPTQNPAATEPKFDLSSCNQSQSPSPTNGKSVVPASIYNHQPTEEAPVTAHDSLVTRTTPHRNKKTAPEMEEETLTLTALLKAAAAAHPSRRAIAVHGKIDLTHAALDALVDAAAARLHTAFVHMA
jgi:hypothetical protein